MTIGPPQQLTPPPKIVPIKEQRKQKKQEIRDSKPPKEYTSTARKLF
uniref:Uncharacterized protein n=1 Tax=viral metagenome TaxID=1070528 RepID=A0A6C0JE19_9ZZZZ